MYELKVGNKTYAIEYNHEVLGETDILDRVIESASGNAKASELVKITAELLLAGLQTHNAEEFGYLTSDDKKSKMKACYAILDEYCKEKDEKGNRRTSFKIFEELQNELGENGFLFGMMDQK